MTTEKINPADLIGRRVQLVPLSLEHHESLCNVGLDPELWQATTIRVQTSEDMLAYVRYALEQQAAGLSLPFVIIERSSGSLVGTTRFHSVNRVHRRIEIGYTWLGRKWQGTGINQEVKYLLLRTAFERMGCLRVEFKADVANAQSRKALAKIGAQQEAVLRSYLYSEHKGPRDVVLFSIVASDWARVKANLENQAGLQE